MQLLGTVTSAFRGRRNSFAQNPELQNKQGRGVNRWVIYKQLCVAKSALDLNDRCLAVLSSLLSFLPDDDMNEKTGLVVFPSNRQLSLRAHGMPESTLRRHLASLVEAGIIARKDSPTRKRYAHKDREGAVELAFGFSFAPLLDRAAEIAGIADKILAEQKALKRLRDEVSVMRREIASTFSENTDGSGDLIEGLEGLFVSFRGLVDTIPRRASLDELMIIKANLAAIYDELAIALKNMAIVPEMSGSVAQSERQHNESLPESLFESQNSKKIDLKVSSSEATDPSISESKSSIPVSTPISLDQVLRTCPDIREYGPNGISTWRELHDASQIVSGFLGISPSAYREALSFMGAEAVSTAIAWILQKLTTISSPGGYLRSLTQKARAGGFSISQLLFAGMKSNGNLALAGSQ
ncbi:plasmid replication protein RepC [Brucella gallinifaecis]|uniref:Replication initiation protein RepC n=1 Tax=Brucella gallinifaecis TaxID=215590 RepID=A0A502BMM8_9HYPH|nr:plasmid replication protein RepC [Brucella gallinifaecis]MCH4544069.1 replication initiation protein RepC [Ochrobactrum sp. A-1]TPF74556.1 replication initiation protein RepC [Brucella gallinifaecis]